MKSEKFLLGWDHKKVLKIFALLSLFSFALIELQAQELQFERKINPFDFKNQNGRNYKFPFIGGFNIPRIQFIDIDDDGDNDLFVQEIDNQLMFFENTGNAQNAKFEWQTDDWLKINNGAWYRFVDIDNDGDIDLFCQGEQELVRFYVNIDNAFSLKENVFHDHIGDSIISELTSVPDFFDIDCDGDKDLFLGRQSGTITFYENISAPKDQTPQFKFVTDKYQDISIIGGALSKSSRHGANSLSFGDLNNDGPADLLYGDFFSSSLYYFINSGTCDTTNLQQESDT